GSVLRRDGREIALDSAISYEITLRHGDRLALGDPNDPVIVEIGLRNGATAREEMSERLIASRSIVDLPAVTDRVEHDPETALKIYKALAPLSARLDMSATLEAVVEAAFD